MPKTKAVARRRTRTVVKRVGSRAKKMTIPLALVAGMAPITLGTINYIRGGGSDVGGYFTSRMIGFQPWDGKWSFTKFKQGGLPIIVGLAIHKIASRLGINRAIASAGIPFIRI